MAADGLHIVTGASGAIGQALTRGLAAAGRHVVMACRNLEKAEPVRRRIAEETGNPNVELLHLDLSSLQSIAGFALRVREDGRPVETLLNNAGVMNGRFALTADGLEQTVGVNYAGPYALTRLLWETLAPEGRVVNTLSCTYRIGKVDDRLLDPDSERFSRFGAYGSSKLALLLFTLELAREFGESGRRAYAADPGVVDTDMIRMGRWFDPLADRLFRPLTKSPDRGAATALALALRELPGPGPEAVYWSGGKARRIPARICAHPRRRPLWEQTEQWLARSGTILA